MASKKRNKVTTKQKEAMRAQLAALLDASKTEYSTPEYQKQRDDVTGFWVPEAGIPIHGVLIGAKVFDSAIESEKPTGLLFFELLDPCPVLQEGKPILAEQGDLVGVWAKPGMRVLKRAQGQKVWMVLEGEKDIGKLNPMKTFDVRFPERGRTIDILEDGRKDSAGRKFWLADGGTETLAKRKPAASDDIAESDVEYFE